MPNSRANRYRLMKLSAFVCDVTLLPPPSGFDLLDAGVPRHFARGVTGDFAAASPFTPMPYAGAAEAPRPRFGSEGDGWIALRPRAMHTHGATGVGEGWVALRLRPIHTPPLAPDPAGMNPAAYPALPARS